MYYTEIISQNHLYGLLSQRMVGCIDVREINYCHIFQKFLLETTEFEIGEICHQHFEARTSDTRVHTLVGLHLQFWKYLIHKLFVDAAVRCARVQHNADFHSRHRSVQQRVVITFF